MNLEVLKPYKDKIIYGVAGLVVIIIATIVITTSGGSEQDSNLNSQIIEPLPLDSLQEEINYENEDAIFFSPSQENTQSVTDYTK